MDEGEEGRSEEGKKEAISVFIGLGGTTHRSFPFDNP